MREMQELMATTFLTKSCSTENCFAIKKTIKAVDAEDEMTREESQ